MIARRSAAGYYGNQSPTRSKASSPKRASLNASVISSIQENNVNGAWWGKDDNVKSLEKDGAVLAVSESPVKIKK